MEPHAFAHQVQAEDNYVCKENNWEKDFIFQ
jgi:hypothetical protein